MIHLVVTYNDHLVGFYSVEPGKGWRIDAATRCLIVGQGVPRKMIPLDSVQVIDIEEFMSASPPAAPVSTEQPRPRQHTTHGCWCGIHHAQMDAP